MENKNRIYRVNKKDNRLYYYDKNTKKRGLASKEELLAYKKELQEELKKEMKIIGFSILFLYGAGHFLTKEIDGYTNIQAVKTRIECFLDRENQPEILDEEINNYLKRFQKEEFIPIYNYLMEHYASRLTVSDMRKTFALFSNDYQALTQENNLVSDCINSITAAKNKEYIGNIRLSIICDIVGEEDAIYWLLTNQEDMVINCLQEKTGRSKDEIKCFLLDLSRLNKVIQNMDVNKNYEYYSVSKALVSTYDRVPIEKELLLSLMLKEEPDFIPVGSFQTRKNDLYPVRIVKDPLNSTVIEVPKSINSASDIQKIFDIMAINACKEAIESNHETVTLLSYLERTSSSMFSYYDNLESDKIKQSYITYLNDYLMKKSIDLNTLLYGIENKDEKAIFTYLEAYIRTFENSEVSIKRICEVNHIIEYFQKQASLEKGEKKIYLRQLLNEFQNVIVEDLELGNAEEYKSLVGRDDVKFERIDNKTQLPQQINYKVIKVKSEKAEEYFWEVKIPKSDIEITPILLVYYPDGTVKLENFNAFFINAKITETDSYIKYEKRADGEEIFIYNFLETYLEKKRKGIQRKKNPSLM